MTKILLVEDTPALAAEIMDILRMEEFDVFLAKNGLDALNQLGVQLVDIVISDLFMPEMDGFQLITEIKAMKNSDIYRSLFCRHVPQLIPLKR